MKRVTIIFLFMISATMAIGQPKMQLSSSEHDFGVFREEAGRQTFKFEVANTGNTPLVIQNIVASCGCTTPDWTKAPIPPGTKGIITAIYDPANRPGKFEKTLTVYTNSNPTVSVIVLKGEVLPRQKSIEELFTWPVTGLRFEGNHLAFTSVKKTEKKIRTMQVINTSKRTVKIGFDGMPAHIELKAKPETLKPGQKGIIEGTYDGSKNPGWGTLTDMVRVKLNDTVQQNAVYVVSASLLEDFSTLSEAELANAPVFKVESTTVDIGKMEQATVKDVEFKFTNAGKRDLIIRYIRATCGCTAIQQDGKTELKPGESSVIKATFNSGSYNGKVTKAIYVYTNDPKNSETILMLSAEVIPKVAGK